MLTNILEQLLNVILDCSIATPELIYQPTTVPAMGICSISFGHFRIKYNFAVYHWLTAICIFMSKCCVGESFANAMEDHTLDVDLSTLKQCVCTRS